MAARYSKTLNRICFDLGAIGCPLHCNTDSDCNVATEFCIANKCTLKISCS